MSRIRQRCHVLLIVAAWVGFLVSMFLPGYDPDMGAWDHGKVMPGWACTLIFFPAWPTNVLLLFSPLLVWVARIGGPRVGGWIAGMLFGTFALTSGVALASAYGFGNSGDALTGFYVWTTSLAIAAAAFLVGPVIRQRR